MNKKDITTHVATAPHVILNAPHVILNAPHVILNAVKDLPGYRSMMRSFAMLRMTAVGLRMTAVVLLFSLVACQQEEEPALAGTLSLTTTLAHRAAGATQEGGQTQIIGGSTLTLVIETEEGQTVTLKYEYDYDDAAWKHDTGSHAEPLLLNGKDYRAYAYGDVYVPWRTDANGNVLAEGIPVTWTGPLTPTVTGTGTAQANLTLTPATARFHVTLLGAYGEKQPLTGFRVTPGVKAYVWDSATNDYIWSNPADPYTTPRTMEAGEYDAPWLLSESLRSLAWYPAGQTIAPGETLFTLLASTTEAQQLYGNKPYTVLLPAGGAALTLEAGHQYNYTLRLDGRGQSVAVVDYTITPMTDDDDTDPISTYRGITTADELVQFAKDFNDAGSDAMKRYTDEGTANGTIRLWADIDMTGKDFEGIGIGNDGVSFPGTFDGQGHTISGLAVTTTGTDVAAMFFKIAGGATVKNLHLRGATITYTGGGSMPAGGIAVGNDGTISGCTVQGTVQSSGAGSVGGITNNNFGTIMACGFRGTLTTNGSTGGITFDNGGTISGCYAITAGGATYAIANIGNGTTTGCVDSNTVNYYLTDADLATMNTALNDAGLQWLRKDATGNLIVMQH